MIGRGDVVFPASDSPERGVKRVDRGNKSFCERARKQERSFTQICTMLGLDYSLLITAPIDTKSFNDATATHAGAFIGFIRFIRSNLFGLSLFLP
jgi:hypothetical protein